MNSRCDERPGMTIVSRRLGLAALFAAVLPLATACGSTPVGPPPTVEPTPIVLPTMAPATPVPTATPRAAKLRFEVANTGGDGANLRAEANAKAKVIATLKDGTVVEAGDAPDAKADDRTWKNVKDPKGNLGWVAFDFLKPVP